MLDCGVDDLVFFNVLWYNRVMFLEMCSVLTVGEVKRVLLQVEECRCHCRCGLSCRMWGKWYMYVD